MKVGVCNKQVYQFNMETMTNVMINTNAQVLAMTTDALGHF